MQLTKSKKENAAKKSNNFGKMMLQKDKKNFQMKEKQAYIQLLKAPRGKEYIRLLGEINTLSKELTDIDENIAQLQKEIEQDMQQLEKIAAQEGTPVQGRAPIQGSSSDTDDLDWLTVDSKSSDLSWLEESSKKEDLTWLDTKITAAQVLKKIEEKKRSVLEFKREQNRLLEEYREKQREFIAQLPVADRCFHLLWPDEHTPILMRKGVIDDPGSTFHSEEELIELSRPQTEEEKIQISKGFHAYQKYAGINRANLLVVEVYIDAVCVVFTNGEVVVIE